MQQSRSRRGVTPCRAGSRGYDARMAQRVAVTVDLGAGAPIEVVRQVIDDLDTACQFGGELQYQVARGQAELAILRRPSAWIDSHDYVESPLPWAFRAVMPQQVFETAVARYLSELNVARETVTTVENIRYSNPIEIVLGAAVLVASVVLPLARDWKARRRLNAAVADDYHNIVLARKEIRDELVRRVVQDGLPLSSEQIDRFLTADVAQALKALGDRQISLRELEAADDDPDKPTGLH